MGHKVRIHTPQKGNKKKLTELANRNARQAYLDKIRTNKTARTAIERLQKALHLKLLPERIECFDISHKAIEFVLQKNNNSKRES